MKRLFPVLSIISVAFFSIIAAVVCIQALMARRKAAVLDGKLRKLEEEKVRAVEDKKLAKSAEDRARAQVAIAAKQREISDLKDRILERKKAHDSFVQKLAEVVSWDAVKVEDAREAE
jgi:hypothetical protein